MRSAGIDVGSRTVKLVVLEQGKILACRKAGASYDLVATCRDILDGVSFDGLVATGYGRHIFAEHSRCRLISEIKAFAIGSRALHPACRAVLDIGGQDTKAIFLDPSGKVVKFEMNDRCAAGTGRFLEIMASALGYSTGEFGACALRADRSQKINSMCTVFAESEVISLIARGARRDEVARGIHEAIGDRILSMLGRLPAYENLVFAGGVAYNRCIRELISVNLRLPVFVPAEPQVVGALGAALEGLDGDRRFDFSPLVMESQYSADRPDYHAGRSAV